MSTMTADGADREMLAGEPSETPARIYGIPGSMRIDGPIFLTQKW